MEVAQFECCDWKVSCQSDGDPLLPGLLETLDKKCADGLSSIRFSIPRVVLALEMFDLDTDILHQSNLFIKNKSNDIGKHCLWLQTISSDWKLKQLKTLSRNMFDEQPLLKLTYLCELFAVNKQNDSLSCAIFLGFDRSSHHKYSTVSDAVACCFQKTKLLNNPRSAFTLLSQIFEDTSGSEYSQHAWEKIENELVCQHRICSTSVANELLHLLQALMGFVSVPPSAWKDTNSFDESLKPELELAEQQAIVNLLQVKDVGAFRKLLSSKSLRIKRESTDILIPLTDEQIMLRVDSVVCELYHLVFQYLISKISWGRYEENEVLEKKILSYDHLLITDGNVNNSSLGSFEELLQNYLDERLYQFSITISHEEVLSAMSYSHNNHEFPLMEGSNCSVFDVLEEISYGPLLADAANELLAQRLSFNSQHILVSSATIGHNKTMSDFNNSSSAAGSNTSPNLLFGVSHYHQNMIYCAEDMIQKNRSGGDSQTVKRILLLSGLSFSTALLDILRSSVEYSGTGSGAVLDEGTIRSSELPLQDTTPPQHIRSAKLGHQKYVNDVRTLIHYLQTSCSTIDSVVDVFSAMKVKGDHGTLSSYLRHNAHLTALLLTNHQLFQIQLPIHDFVSQFGHSVDIQKTNATGIHTNLQVVQLAPRLLSYKKAVHVLFKRDSNLLCFSVAILNQAIFWKLRVEQLASMKVLRCLQKQKRQSLNGCLENEKRTTLVMRSNPIAILKRFFRRQRARILLIRKQQEQTIRVELAGHNRLGPNRLQLEMVTAVTDAEPMSPPTYPAAEAQIHMDLPPCLSFASIAIGVQVESFINSVSVFFSERSVLLPIMKDFWEDLCGCMMEMTREETWDILVFICLVYTVSQL